MSKALASTLNQSSRRRAALSRGREVPPTMLIGGGILLMHLAIAVTGPWWAPFGPSQVGTGVPFGHASWDHLFGTDSLGRDVFSRVVYGARVVLVLALAGTVIGAAAGTAIGLLSAYFQGWFDELVMRLADATISIPFVMLAILAVAAAGPERTGSPGLLILIIAILYAPRMARMARARAMEIVPLDFVTIARTRGESAWSIVTREVLPVATGTLLVEFAVRLGNAPVIIGSLGFLGIGLRPPTPEWGLMISENRNALLTSPITVLGPALVLASLVIGANLFTDGLARTLGQSVRLAPK